jgi:hypothetical protein
VLYGSNTAIRLKLNLTFAGTLSDNTKVRVAGAVFDLENMLEGQEERRLEPGTLFVAKPDWCDAIVADMKSKRYKHSPWY